MPSRYRSNRLPPTPPPLRHRVHSPSGVPAPGSLARVRRIAREHAAEERPFDPERRGTWRGSSRDLVVNPARARRGDKHGKETDEEFLVIEGDDGIQDTAYIFVNPLEYPRGRYHSGMRKEHLYGLHFGAYGWTKVLVWARSLETALEEASGWLADHAPGIFVDQKELTRLEEEYRDEHPDADDDEVYSEAYQDLTYTESGYIPSWEWGIGFDSENAGTDNDFYRVALEASKEAYEAEYGEED